MMSESLIEFAGYFAIKDLLLMKRTGGLEFLVGDSPIALHNDRQFGPYGNIGLAVQAIQINLPISPELSLAYWCETLLSDMEQRLALAKKLLDQAKAWTVLGRPDLAAGAAKDRDQLAAQIAHSEALFGAFKDRRAIDCDDEQVTHYNSLQIGNAERWLFSRNGDFQLAERMIADNSKFRSGRRVTMN